MKTSKRSDEFVERVTAHVKDTSRPTTRRRTNYVAQQEESMRKMHSKKSIQAEQWLHDPKRIRTWSGHNRDYAALTQARCVDLIDDFRLNGQQFPAIVRKLEGDTEYDYELICGARRHWTATFLNRDLMIEIRDIDDRGAFTLQDIENRHREDISDYERAVDYKKALPLYFDGVKQRMADDLKIDKSDFGRLLALADLPKPIVDAYADIRDLVLSHMKTYTNILKDPKDAERVIRRAKDLKGKGLSGKEVIKELKAVFERKQKKTVTKHRLANKFIDIAESSKGFTIKFDKPKQGDPSNLAGVRKSLLKLLDELDQSDDAATLAGKKNETASA